MALWVVARAQVDDKMGAVKTTRALQRILGSCDLRLVQWEPKRLDL